MNPDLLSKAEKSQIHGTLIKERSIQDPFLSMCPYPLTFLEINAKGGEI